MQQKQPRFISCEVIGKWEDYRSSAIIDYLSEFDSCYSISNYEFRFLQDPYGISDLEFILV